MITSRIKRLARQKYKGILTSLISEYQKETGATDIKVFDVETTLDFRINNTIEDRRIWK